MLSGQRACLSMPHHTSVSNVSDSFSRPYTQGKGVGGAREIDTPPEGNTARKGWRETIPCSTVEQLKKNRAGTNY